METRKRPAAALRPAADGIRDIRIHLAHFRTEPGRTVGVMRQLKHDAEVHSKKRRPPVFGGGLPGGLPGGLVIAWLAHGFLGGQPPLWPALEHSMVDQTPVRFLNSMFDGTDRVAILAIPRAVPDGRVEQRFAPAGTAAGRTQAWLRYLNAQRYDIYLGVNPVRPDSTRREKEDIAEVRRLQVDLDDNGPENLKRLLGDAARGVIPQPRHLLRSSTDHYQVLWDTARGQWSPDQAEATMRSLAARYGGDPACSEVARVMRWPGYRNHKEGRDRTLVSWIDRGGKPVSPDDFRALPAPEMRTARDGPVATGRRPTRERPNRISRSEKDWAWVKDQLKAGADPLQLREELARRRADKAKPDAYAALTVEKAMRAVANENHHHEREINR